MKTKEKIIEEFYDLIATHRVTYTDNSGKSWEEPLALEPEEIGAIEDFLTDSIKKVREERNKEIFDKLEESYDSVINFHWWHVEQVFESFEDKS